MTHLEVSSLWPKFLFSCLLLAPALTLADDVVEVTGTVVDEQGQPAAGMKVTPLSSLPKTPGVTDAAGKFTVKYSALDRGPNAILTQNEDGSRQGYVVLPDRGMFMTTDRPKPAPVKIDLKPARKLSAEVVDETGKPITDAIVTVVGSYQQLAEELTDKAGHATLRVPADARLQSIVARKDEAGLDYFLFRNPRDPASDPYKLAGDNAGPFKFVLEGIRPMRVRLIDGKGEPLSGIEVFPSYFTLPKKGGQAQVPSIKVATDEQGIASFRFVPKGNSQRINSWSLAKEFVAQERILFDPAGKNDEVTVTLLPVVKVSGRVVLADGAPAGGALILAHGDGYQFDGYFDQTKADAEGRFTLSAHPQQFLTLHAVRGNFCSGLESFLVLDKPPEKEVLLKLQPATRVFGRMTIGPDRRPMTDQYVQLYSSSTVDYYKLPEVERLPNPRGDSKGISTLIGRNAITNKQGQFEFFVPPGRHSLNGSNQQSTEFTITDQRELEIDLHAARPATVEISGRVVHKGDPKKGVAEATIQSRLTEDRGRSFYAVSDVDGRFHAQRSPSEMLVYAATPDGKLAAIVKLGADEDSVELPLASTASARGRLVAADYGGEPLAGRQIEWGVKIESDRGGFSMAFGGNVVTDKSGQFQIKRLVPGWKYTLYLVTETEESDGIPARRSMREFASVTPEAGQPLADLGEFVLRSSSEIGPLGAFMDKKFGGDQPPPERLKSALLDARLNEHRVLWLVTTRKLPECRRLFNLFYVFDEREPNLDHIAVFSHFRVIGIDTTAEELAPAWKAEFASRKLDWPAADETLLIVLDGAGKVVGQSTAKDLATDGKLSRIKLVEFLSRHVPDFPDARQILSDAQALAKREDKRVWVQQSGAHFAPSLKILRYFEANKDLLAKDFVIAKLDYRYANGKTEIDRLRPKSNGVPWTVILDAEGKPLIDSDGPEGSIGYPGSVVGKKHFEKMLRDTARRLSDKEIKTLISKLEE